MPLRKTPDTCRKRESAALKKRNTRFYLPDLCADYGYDKTKHLLPRAELEAAVTAWQGGDKAACERAVMGVLPWVWQKVESTIPKSLRGHAHDVFQHVLSKLPVWLLRWDRAKGTVTSYVGETSKQTARTHLHTRLKSHICVCIPQYLLFADAPAEVMRVPETLTRPGERGEHEEVVPAKERAHPLPEPGELDHVKALVHALPEPGRKILMQRYGGKSVREVAEKMGKTRLWVRKQENEAMRRLRAAAMAGRQK